MPTPIFDVAFIVTAGVFDALRNSGSFSFIRKPILIFIVFFVMLDRYAFPANTSMVDNVISRDAVKLAERFGYVAVFADSIGHAGWVK